MSEAMVRDFATTRRYSESTIERWVGSVARDSLLSVAERWKLGENQFCDLFDAIEDIAARRGISSDEVFGLPEIAIGATSTAGRNEAIKAFKQILRRLRFPRLEVIEDRLSSLRTSVSLPRSAKMEFPENLDGRHIALSFRASSAEDLRKIADSIATIARRPEIEEMFDLLGGHF